VQSHLTRIETWTAGFGYGHFLYLIGWLGYRRWRDLMPNGSYFEAWEADNRDKLQLFMLALGSARWLN